MRRRVPWAVLVVLFVLVPLVEIYLVVQAGQVIGLGWTLLLLIADSVLGAYLVKREGARAWQALRVALQASKMPARELADGALILVGGTLLLTPGFLTDAFGFFAILPLTRPLARRALSAFLTRRFLDGQRTGRRRRPGPDSVVQGEVVD